MKIKYEFVTGAVEVEVTDDWGTILVDLDRQEYNVNHKETRRHCSLDAYNQDDALLPSDEDVMRSVLIAEDNQRLFEAITHLNAEQQELVRVIFFEEMSVSEYAKRHGITQSAASQRKKAVLKKMKKYFS